MFADLLTRSRRLLARHRDRASMRVLHRVASFIEDCYENDEWDMQVNGETALLRRLAPARFTTVVDVGAHLGEWSIAALRAWPGSRVHAFEVAPLTYERLERNIAAAGLLDRATLVCKGLGDTTTTRDMFYYPDHPNLTCDRPRHAYHNQPFAAQLVEGDSYLRQHDLGPIDFLKIDVEGAEHLVLHGLSRALAADRVRCIQFEYGAFSIDTHVLLADYYEMLASRYWIGKIFPATVEFRDYDWRMESFRFSNFLCVSRGRPDLRALAQGSSGNGTKELRH